MLPVSIVAFGLLLALLTKARLPRAAALAVCTGIFLGLAFYLVIVLSWGLGAEAFDESVIYHVVSGYSGVPKGILIPVLSVTAIGLIAAAALCAWLYSKARRRQRPARLVLTISVLSVLAFFTNPVVADLASTGYFRLTESSAQPPEYKATPVNVQFTQKPNIVYIYLESLEHTFLNEKLFPGLTPHLQRLESEAVSLTNLQQTYGTGWTMAGMVASQCGIPLSTDIWNSMSGLDQFLPGATCLGDVLSAQGYTLHYLGGAELAFGGKGSFYRSHRFNRVQGQAELAGLLRDPGYQNEWGLYDDTLFEMFKQRFDKLAAKKQPFGLFTLTNSTHPPDGNLPRTCDARYGDGTDHILDAVQCTDRYVAEVVDHIRHSSAGGNTIIVIGSDHLAMRSKTTERWLEKQQRRDLLLILAPGMAAARIDKPGTTLDVGPTLLGMISNIHSLGFGTDLRGNAKTLLQEKLDPHRFLMSKVPFLNTLWEFPSPSHGMAIDPVQADLTIQSRRIHLPVLFLLDGNLRAKDVVFPGRNDLYALSAYVARLPRGQRFLWIDRCGELAWLGNPQADGSDRGYCLAHGTLNDAALAITHLGDSPYTLDADAADALLRPAGGKQAPGPNRASAIEAIKHYNTANVATVPDGAPAAGGYAIVAGAGVGRQSFVELRKKRTYLEPGATLVALAGASAPPRLQMLELCGAGSSDKQPAAEPEHAAAATPGENQAVIVVRTATDGCRAPSGGALPAVAEKLAGWRDLKADDAYIGIVAPDGLVAEYVVPAGTTLAVQAALPGTPHAAAPGLPDGLAGFTPE
jgi:phosphoglycerol transferase